MFILNISTHQRHDKTLLIITVGITNETVLHCRHMCVHALFCTDLLHDWQLNALQLCLQGSVEAFILVLYSQCLSPATLYMLICAHAHKRSITDTADLLRCMGMGWSDKTTRTIWPSVESTYYFEHLKTKTISGYLAKPYTYEWD